MKIFPSFADCKLRLGERKLSLLILPMLMLLTALPGFAQGKWVSGTVTDQDGEPLIGVTVKIEGTSIGTATDLDGKYRLDGALGKELLFSYVGYASQKIKAD